MRCDVINAEVISAAFNYAVEVIMYTSTAHCIGITICCLNLVSLKVHHQLATR